VAALGENGAYKKRGIAMHECPRCGKMTDGSWSSEGSFKWAICEDCMRQEREELEYGRREAERICEYGYWIDE